MPAQIIDLTNLAAEDGFIVVGDAPGDQAGYSVSAAGDVNGDGIDDIIVGAPRGDDGGFYAGEAYVIFGKAGATRATIDLSSLAAADGFIIQGDTGGDTTGFNVSSAGDINGDGIDDLIVGAPNSDIPGIGGGDAGEAYVIFGKAGATRANIDLTSLAAADGFIIMADTGNDKAGHSVSGAGDINGDGIDDLLVGAFAGDDGGTDAGEVYVIFGQSGAMRANIDLTSLATSDGFIIQGDAAGDVVGWSVSNGGDVNGDSIDDLIVGAQEGDDGGSNAGEAYVIFGKTGATRANIDLTSLAADDGFVIVGDVADDKAGFSVSNAGDINGDGIDDLIVGAVGNDGGGATAGTAYVIYGKTGATRANIDLSSLAASDGFFIQGDAAGDQAGRSVSGAGDINGDGIDDLIVGAAYGDDGGYNAGEAYVIFGKAGATRANIDLTALALGDGMVIQGDAAFDRAGNSVSAAGDINDDGIDDLIVGAPNSFNSGTISGSAYVIFGSRLFGAVNGSAAGETLTGTAGDDTINGLGGNDVIDGGAGADTMRGGADNDIYIVDDTGDVVVELAGEGGQDRVETGLTSYVLPAEVENLEYFGAGAFSGTGNGSANSIVGGAGGDTLSGMDGDDTLGGEAGDDMLDGGNGSDRLFGGAGADIMNGEAGNDRMIVDSAGDVANGGDGIDTVQFTAAGLSYTLASDVEIVSNHSGGALTVTLNALGNTYGGSNAVDTVNAGDGQDSVYGRAGNDVLRGQAGNDYLFGDAGLDTLEGGDGADFLYGGTENDTVLGGAGNDSIFGEAGNDLITGGAGLDVMSGGTGNDRFIFTSASDTGASFATADRITDFAQAQFDRFDVSQIDAIAGGDPNSFSFLGANAFTNVAGQLRYQHSGGNTYIQGDTNGDGVADFVIRVDGVHVLSASDFFF